MRAVLSIPYNLSYNGGYSLVTSRGTKNTHPHSTKNELTTNCVKMNQNKTSIQWTPGSQVYLSKNKQKNWSKMIFEQKNKKVHKSCIIND